jgi:hypothetical protein
MTRTGPVIFGFVVFALVGTCCYGPALATADTAAEQSPAEKAAWSAPDQEAAKKRAAEVVPFVEAVMDECRLCRQQRLRDMGLGVKDQTESYFLLDSPIIRKTENHYGPVRFMHAKHANVTKDCALCHHYRPVDEAASETTRCSACHQQSFQKDHPERLGLKAAYHQQCMGCHKQINKGPIDCAGCHRKNIPDHKALIELAANPEPSQVTRECLRCHQQAGEDMLKSAHWLWKGPSPYTLNHRKEVELGKATVATNNF